MLHVNIFFLKTVFLRQIKINKKLLIFNTCVENDLNIKKILKKLYI